MSVFYCYMAKDAELILFENKLDKEISQSQCKNNAETRISEWHAANPMHNPALDDEENETKHYECQPLTGVSASGNRPVELHSIYHTIHIGIVTETNYPQDKAQKYLAEVREQFNQLYKGNLPFVHQ